MGERERRDASTMCKSILLFLRPLDRVVIYAFFLHVSSKKFRLNDARNKNLEKQFLSEVLTILQTSRSSKNQILLVSNYARNVGFGLTHSSNVIFDVIVGSTNEFTFTKTRHKKP